MKRVANMPAHYGKTYIAEALGSIVEFVDLVYVLYTDKPSYAQTTDLKSPDSEDELYSLARTACGRKLHWIKGQWNSEGQHRNYGYSLSPDADLILQLDTDEIWDRDSLARCIQQASDGKAKNYGIRGFVHFWRSFLWACHDCWTPVRIIKPSGHGDVNLEGRIYHFGYAQPVETVGYKMSCHGHKSEIRPDWFETKFMANAKTDVHPVVRGWWNAKPLDPSLLPQSLKDHPNFGKDVIT